MRSHVREPLIKSLGAATAVLKPRPFGFRRYEPICGAAEPGRESLISTRNLQLAYRLILSETRLPEDLIRGSLAAREACEGHGCGKENHRESDFQHCKLG